MRHSLLRHNRDFRILCATQGVSRFGTQLSMIAFPLLVLKITRSPADAGIVGFAEGLAIAVTLLPAGVAADRFSRRAIMIMADVGNTLTMTALGVAVLLRAAPIAMIIPAAVLGAVFSACFSPAVGAAMRQIVSDADMTTAVSVNQVRNAVLTLAGPAIGGLLFEISHSLPFFADAGSYAISLLGTIAISTPLTAGQTRQQRTSGDAGNVAIMADMLRGVKFIYQHQLLRLTTLNSALLNFAFTGILLAVIITTVRDGSTSLTTGSIVALIGGGTLLGSLLAPRVSQRLTLSQALVAFTWISGNLVTAMVLTSNAAVLAGLVACSVTLIPALNVLLTSAQTIITPNALQGRVQSAISFNALCISPLGAVTVGFLLNRWPPGVAFACFGGAILILAALNTASRSQLNSPVPAPSDAAPVPVDVAPAAVPSA